LAGFSSPKEPRAKAGIKDRARELDLSYYYALYLPAIEPSTNIAVVRGFETVLQNKEKWIASKGTS
jgi:hypothetical protein